MNVISIHKNTNGNNIRVDGYNYDWLQNAYLSSYSVTFPSLTSIDRHTTISRVSATCPVFTGYMLPLSSYTVVNRNTIILGLSSEFFVSGSGTIDIIFESIAGYTKLSDKNFTILVN